jgi:hypothetical protein
MIDQLIIGNTKSYDTFGASVAERKIHPPKKKTIKETVPFSNKTHDFSAIDGEVYWEDRILEYVFEILADSPEELEEKKTAFFSWIMNVRDEKLYDPFTKGYYYLATYDDCDPDDSEIEKSTITVTFTAYPYKIADKPTVTTQSITTSEKSININNTSSHRITPTFNSNVSLTVTVNGSSYSLPSGEVTSESIVLNPGNNTVKFKSTSGSGTLTISYSEEVF